VQYQYKGWPDHGVPTNGRILREIMRNVEEDRANDFVRRPIVVHCSAGLGRTGTFIAIHQNIIKMKRAFANSTLQAKDYYINLYQDVLLMRGCRSGMVQQPAQYTFCYKAIAEEALENGFVDAKNVDVPSFYGESKSEPHPATEPVARALAQSSQRFLWESTADDDDDEDEYDFDKMEDDFTSRSRSSLNPLGLSRMHFP